MRMKLIFAAALCALLCRAAAARDVDLDGIYLKDGSMYRSRLFSAKLDQYAAVDAVLVSGNVAFAGWSSGARIVYVKEASGSVSLEEYFPSSRRTHTVAEIPGGVVYARIPVNSRYAYLSMLVQGKSVIPESFLTLVDMRNGDCQKMPSRSIFVDYALSRGGSSFTHEEGNALWEIFPDTGRRRSLLTRDQYSSVARKNVVTIGIPSPDLRRILVLAGDGGSYDGAVFEDGVLTRRIEGISSCVDLTWIDNRRIAYREGGPGQYVLRVYDAVDGTSFIAGSRTMNTNLAWCEYNGILSSLTDGALTLRYKDGRTELCPLEGEDAVFSPGGNAFCLLYNGRLFIVQKEKMKDRTVELRRAAVNVLSVYRDLLSAPGEWANTFSGDYIRRKISLYEKLTAVK